MKCCEIFGQCAGGDHCPHRATPLVDASRKALAVLSLTGADPALQNELVGAMAEPDRIAELTAQLEAVRAVWRKDIARIAELAAQRDELLAALERIASTKPQHGMNPNAKMSDPADVKVCWNVHLIASSVIAKHQPTAAP